MSEVEQVVDAEVVERAEERQDTGVGGALVPTGAQSPAVTPQVQAAELVERLDVIRNAMENAMQETVDYGKVPGTDKPTLFKPGAEKLSVLFQLDVQLDNEKVWGPDAHLTVISHATAYHAPSGARLGYGEGICTTRERKYAYRKKQRVCPKCGVEAIIKGKEEFGGGWVCWKKKDGCDAKFPDGSTEIEEQEAGEVENPDLPDLWNTIVKMAEKRARVDAVLAVTGASALFTQDLEDAQPAAPDDSRPTPTAKSSTGFASDRQRKFCERLLGEAGFNALGTAEVCDFMRSTMAKSEISSVIDKLKEGSTRAATADQLQRDAAEFTKGLDVDGGAPAQPVASDEDIPF